MQSSLGQVVRLQRRKSRLTLRSAAANLDVSPSLLSLIEQDKHVPPADLITKLARMFGGDPDQWCGLAGTLTPGAEASLAEIAKEQPEYFRTMIRRIGR